MNYNIPTLPLTIEVETKAVLKQAAAAHRRLAELKGIANTIPNENILINTLTLQEAKDSSEVENIVTTQDELYKEEATPTDFISSASTKEVLKYREAIQLGFAQIRENKLLTNNVIKQIQQMLEGNKAGFRKVPGTALKNGAGEIVYTPPQNPDDVEKYMANLELFINDETVSDCDPLVKMAIIHHQFESIHPFYDGNGRTGRIVVILYLVANNLLDLPILYLSRYITHNKGEYYRLLQAVRTSDGKAEDWQNWIMFMLKGVEQTAAQTITIIKGISSLMADFKQKLRPILGKAYKHELLNNLFFHPYTKIEFVEHKMQVQRKTAAKYLDLIVDTGLLDKVKIKHSNYYINTPLVNFFMNVGKNEN